MLIAFDEEEKCIMKGVLLNVEPENREQTIVEFLRGNLDNAMLNDTSDGIMMMGILSGMLDKILSCSHEELIDILDGDYSNVFDDDEMVWLPYSPEESDEILDYQFGTKKKNPLTNSRKAKSVKRNSTK